MHVLAISGSARAASTNTALLRGLARHAPEGMTVEVFAGVGALPVFSPDLEGPATPRAVLDWAARVGRADALVISCPEYAHALPGGLKNALDWLVSRPEIIGKPAALVHASHRGDDVLADLRRVLSTVTERFLPDVFLRVPLMSKTPVEIAEILDRPEEAARLRAWLETLATAARAP